MPRIWWITGKNGLPLPNGRVIADTYGEADKILFRRMLNGECSTGCTVEEEDTPEEVEAVNILSVE